MHLVDGLVGIRSALGLAKESTGRSDISLLFILSLAAVSTLY